MFGCEAYAHITKDERRKLDPKSRKSILLGYGEETKGYRLYDTDNRKVFHSRDVQLMKQSEKWSLSQEEIKHVVELDFLEDEVSRDVDSQHPLSDQWSLPEDLRE